MATTAKVCVAVLNPICWHHGHHYGHRGHLGHHHPNQYSKGVCHCVTHFVSGAKKLENHDDHDDDHDDHDDNDDHSCRKGVCHYSLTQFVGGAIKIGSGLLLHQHLATLESDNI